MVDKYLDKPIFITGCARSGTSLTAGIIERCGAWGGKTQKPNSNNERGMYENVEIRTNVTKTIIRQLGYDPLGQNPLPDIQKVMDSVERFGPQTRAAVLGILANQGREKVKHMPWYYKGPKICLIWPIWAEAFPDAKWVIVRRNDYDICSSCLRATFMRAFNRRGGWKFWVNEHKKRFDEMKAFELDIIEYYPFDAVEGKMDKTRELISCLGLEWDEKAINEFISPDLWHFKEERGV